MPDILAELSVKIVMRGKECSPKLSVVNESIRLLTSCFERFLTTSLFSDDCHQHGVHAPADHEADVGECLFPDAGGRHDGLATHLRPNKPGTGLAPKILWPEGLGGS